MIAIDTDILAVHHIFHNSPRYETTREFFARIGDQPKAITDNRQDIVHGFFSHDIVHKRSLTIE